MKAIDILNQLTALATDYRIGAIKSVERNRHMNQIEEGEQLQQRHIDAILVDFINAIAINYGIDYALYTRDIQ